MDLRRLLGATLRLLQAAAGTSRTAQAQAPRRGGRASADPPRASAVERMPPAFADRLARGHDARSSEKWVKTWRTVPSAFVPLAALRVQSLPGSAAIPPSSPLAGRRTSQTCPSRSIQKATPWRCGRARALLRSGKASGVAARVSGAVLLKRAGPASRRFRAGRWSRRDPSCAWAKSPARSGGHHLETSAARFARGSDRARPREARDDTRSTLVSTARRALAERDRGDSRRRYRRRCPAACASSAASAGSRRALATSRAQAMRLRARA